MAKSVAGALMVGAAVLAGCAAQPRPDPGWPEEAPPAAGRPTTADEHAARGRALAEAGQLDAALSDLNRAIRLDPLHAHAVYERALIHHAAGRAAEAMADINRAVLLDPNNTRMRNARCVIQVTAEGNSAGLKNCHFAMLMPGPAAESQTAFGQALLMLGRPREALAAFDAALKADAMHLPARQGRSVARQLLGDAGGAADVEEAGRSSPAAGRTVVAASAP